MFAFLCIVSSDTPVLAMRPKVSCLRACALCWRPHRVGMTQNTRQVPEVTPPTVSCELHLGSDHTEDGVGSKDEKVPAQWEVPSVMIS